MLKNKNITLPVSLTILLILMVISAIFLRLHNLGNPSLWMDEGWSLHFASQPLKELPSVLASEDKHPPLYYALLHYWLKFGNSEFILRLPSAIFGILIVFITFLMARKIFDIQTAVLSSLFLAFSSFHILMSQEARMYPLASFFSLLAIYFLYRGMDEKKALPWLGYALSASAAIYTHFITGLVLLSANIFALISAREKKTSIWKGLLISNLFAFLAFLPWIKIFLLQAKSPFFQHSQLTLINLLDIFYVSTTGFTLKFPHLAIWYLIMAVGVALFALGAASSPKFIRIYIAGIFLFTIFLSFSLSRLGVAQLFETKYMVPILPLFWILVSRAILNFKPISRWCIATVLILINLSSINNYYTDPRFQRQDWRTVAGYLSTRCTSEDTIIIMLGESVYAFDYYFKKYGVKPNEVLINRVNEALTNKKLLESLNIKELAESKKIWLIRNASWTVDPDDKIMNELDDNFKFLGEIKTNNINFDFAIIVSEYAVPERLRREVIY